MWTVVVTSVILKCFGEVGAFSMKLSPSPIARVTEGNPLILNCSCYEAITPDYINWYLNNDTLGLVIDTHKCKYQSKPKQYDIGRYNISCHETEFYLCINSILKDKDDHATWKCDATAAGMHLPQMISTKIMVMDAGKGKKDGLFDEPKTVSTTWIVVIGVVITAVLITGTTVGYCLYRKRRNVAGYLDRYRNRRNDDARDIQNTKPELGQKSNPNESKENCTDRVGFSTNGDPVQDQEQTPMLGSARLS